MAIIPRSVVNALAGSGLPSWVIISLSLHSLRLARAHVWYMGGRNAGRAGGGIHLNANRKKERGEKHRKALRVRKRQQAGTRQKHVAQVQAVAGKNRTGKAARKQQRLERRLAKEALTAAGQVDVEMKTAPKLIAPQQAQLPAPTAMDTQ